MYYKLLFLLLLLFSQTLRSQPSPFTIEWLSNDPRLILNDEISDVRIDSEGNLWIVSFSELIKYDGLEFKEIAIRNRKQSAFLRFEEDAIQGPYLLTASGEIFFIQSDSLVSYESNFIIRSRIRQGILVDWGFLENGSYYLTNASGTFLFKYRGVNKLKLLPEKEPPSMIVALKQRGAQIYVQRDIAKEKSSSEWKNNLVLIGEDNTILNYWKSENDQYSYNQDIVQIDSLYYFSTGTGHLLVLDHNGRLEEVDFNHTIIRLFVDSDTNLWISTKSNGVHLIPKGDFSHPDRVVFFTNEFAVVSGEDFEGGIWGYQENKGVFRIRKSIFSYINITSEKDNINKVYSIEKYGKGLLISSQDMLYAYDLRNKKLEQKNIPKDILNAYQNKDKTVYSIFKDKVNENLWLSRRGGVMELKGNEWKESRFFAHPNPGIAAKYILNSQSFSNELAFKGFVYKYIISKSIVTDSWIKKEITNHQINDIITLNDSTFIWTKEGICLAQNNDTALLSERYPQLDAGAGLTDWEYFNDKLWITTTSGTYVLSDSLVEFKHEGKKIRSALLIPEDNYSIWLFTKEGSYNIVFSDSENTITHKYLKIPNHIYTDFTVVDGICYLGTKKNGMLTFCFEDLKQLEITQPILLIREIDLGGKKIEKIDSTYSTAYFNNTLKVRYSGISYDSRLVNYRYLLEGFNREWIETKDNFLQYTNISPGKYTLRLQVRKGDQIWADEQQFSFYIVPPYWQRWWFILTTSFIILLLVIFIFKKRTEAINKEKSLHISRLLSEQKALRAKMDPHFIFNIISSLQYLVIDNKNEKALHFLEKFSSLMRSTLDQTNLDVTTLGSEIYFLREYIEMEQLRLENRFNFIIDCDEGIDKDTKIPNFIIQPFVENAIQHGLKNKVGNGLLKVVFTKKDETILVSIEDDGVGYNQSKKQKQESNKGYISQGIRLVRDRLRLRDKKNEHLVEIVDLNELDEKKNGTRVKLKIKIER